VTLPARFEDEDLLNVLEEHSNPGRRLYVVTQFNHPKEITKQSIKAVDNLIKSGVILNNQTVLLKGVKEKAKEKCNGHSKRFKYVMSHKSGKIEILGIVNGEIYFKYHQAKKRKDLGKIFKPKVDKKAGWLEDFKHKRQKLKVGIVDGMDLITVREELRKHGVVG